MIFILPVISPPCTFLSFYPQAALVQLHEQEQSVAEINEFLPYLKPLCQSGEWSRILATGRAMKHQFDCLIRRADERQRMLHQAFREDLQVRFIVPATTCLLLRKQN